MVKERTMNKKELKRRGKGLLALLLAFMMMFGSSMTVFAGKVYVLDLYFYEDPEDLKVGQKLEGGDIIEIVSGSLMVTIDGDSRKAEYDDGIDRYRFKLPAGHQYLVDEYTTQGQPPFQTSYSVILSTVPATPSGSTGNTSTGNASTESGSDDTGNEYWKGHVHNFSWVTTREATAEQDGIQENRCSCGLVQDTTVISAS